MLKRAALPALLLLSALGAPVCSHAAPLYAVTQFLDNFTAYDINNGGQMAGALVADDGATHAALYGNGALTDLGTMGGAAAHATALNDAGAMTGTVFGTTGEWHGFVYSNGVTTDLGWRSEGYGINARGDAVGRAWTGDGTYTALLYSDGQLRSLGSLGMGNYAIAYDINDIGQAVGVSLLLDESHAPFHPFLYSDGAMRDLGSLAYGGVSSANAINNAGRIAGYSEGVDGTFSAFIYENATMTFLGNLGGSFVNVGGINEHGAFVGNADTANGSAVGYIYLAGALVDLNTLLDPALGWQIDGAVAINDLGQIAAHGCRDGLCGTVRLDLASAVPEPGAAGMLVPGLLALATVWRRQKRQGSVTPGMPGATASFA
jgi:probable HAF family extracellular repeat protein